MTATIVSNDVWVKDIPCTTREIDENGKVQSVNLTISDFATHIKLIKSEYPKTGTTKYQVRFDGYQTFDMTQTDFESLKSMIDSGVA